MRTQTVFLLLVILLCLCRVGDLCGSASQYIEARGLLSLDQIPGNQSRDEAASAALRERKNSSLEKGIQSGIEILMLGGVSICFFAVLKRRKEASEKVAS